MELVFIGDSLTWGGYGGNFVSIVAQQMPDHEIINAGVGGDTVVNLLRRVEPLLEQHEPDAMFVMVGGNDAVSYSQPLTRPYYQSTRQIPGGVVTPETFTSTYRDLLIRIQSEYVRAFVGLPPTEYSADLVRVMQTYNDRAREVAESLNVPVLDLAAAFIPAKPAEREPLDLRFIQQIGRRSAQGWQDYETERARHGYTYSFDGMHLLPRTAREFANRITRFLENHL